MKGLIGHLVLAIAIIVAAGVVIGAVSFPELLYYFMSAMERLLSFAMQSIVVITGG